jgi:glyoxylase-like metal-dependent hydrolase (beta-lactamase superfamily II)
MRRRTFLSASALAAAGTLTAPSWLDRVLAQGESLRALREGMHVFSGRKGGTIGVFLSKQAAAVIDTQFPDTAKACLDLVRAKSERKLDAVFITHHHGDHTAGSGVFKSEAARIVAQKNVPELQKSQAERRGSLAEQTYADTLFEKVYSLDLGKEVARAKHFGPGHTGGDAIWSFERANVVHMGDLVFHKMVPFIDRPGGASIQGWMRVLGQALETYPKDARYIFGHAGEKEDVVGGPDALRGMSDYLGGLLDYVKKGKAAGKTLDELAAVERIPGFEAYAPRFEGAIKINVQAAWEELFGAPAP